MEDEASQPPREPSPESPERTLRIASAALRLISTAADERELLEGVCRLLVDDAGYALAWVGAIEAEPERRVRPVAWSGDEGYVREADVRWDDSPRGRGPTGRAARSGRPVALNAVTSEPDYAPWLEAAGARGYRASCAVPLRVDGERSAVLNVYAERADAFHAEEVALLEELTQAVGRGVALFRARQEAAAAAERSRSARDQLAAVYQASPDAIFLHSEDGRILDVNETAVRQYGMPREELLTCDPSLMMSAEHTLEEALERISEALRTGGVDFEWTARGSDGSCFPVEIRLRRLAGASEGSEGPAVVAVVRDLTERHRLQAQMIEAAKLESLSFFAGGVAHDFNNAMSAVLGALSLAARELPPHSSVAAVVEDAIEAASGVRGLTRQLLAFARGGSGEVSDFDVAPLLAQSARLALAGTAVKVEIDLPGDLPYAHMDREQLAAVLHNVLLNAAQAMPYGGQVRLRALEVGADAAPETLAPGRYLRIDIADTGPGIPEAELRHVLDPFFTTKDGGTGLGLPTASAVMRRHGGQLEIESEPGRGATVSLFMPAVERGSLSEGPLGLQRSERSLRVLLLEDEAPLRRVLIRILQELGHRVVSATDGDEALDLAQHCERAGGVDLALLDLTIRGGRGAQSILPELRATMPSTKLVGMSGYSGGDESLSEFDGFLPKPFSVAQLERLLVELFG